MKKLVLIALAFVALTANAQRGERVKDLSAEEIASLQTKKLTLALVLTEAQIKKVHKLNLEQAENRIQKRAARKNKKEEAKGDKNHLAQREKMLDERIALQNKMQEILDEAQFEQWRKMAQKGKKGRGKKAGERKNGERRGKK